MPASKFHRDYSWFLDSSCFKFTDLIVNPLDKAAKFCPFKEVFQYNICKYVLQLHGHDVWTSETAVHSFVIICGFLCFRSVSNTLKRKLRKSESISTKRQMSRTEEAEAIQSIRRRTTDRDVLLGPYVNWDCVSNRCSRRYLSRIIVESEHSTIYYQVLLEIISWPECVISHNKGFWILAVVFYSLWYSSLCSYSTRWFNEK